MSPMQMLLLLWGAVTLMLVVLMIYRSTLVMHEDDQPEPEDHQDEIADGAEPCEKLVHQTILRAGSSPDRSSAAGTSQPDVPIQERKSNPNR